jgi:hypothetical protein
VEHLERLGLEELVESKEQVGLGLQESVVRLEYLEQVGLGLQESVVRLEYLERLGLGLQE